MTEEIQSTDDDDALGLTPRRDLLISLSVAMWFVVFFGAAAASAFSPEATFWLGSRKTSARIPLTREQGLPIFIALISIPALLVGAAIWANMRRAWKSAEAGAVAPQIPLSETVLWSGRLGWRSFRGPRVLGALMTVLVPTGMLWWMFAVLTNGRPLIRNMPGLMFLSFLFFLNVLPAVIQSSSVTAFWLYDVFGRIVVTRRRVVWLTPLKRQIYRQITGADVVDAFVAESEGRRGSVTVIKRVKDDVEHVYLDGLPDPEQAHQAIQSLIRYPVIAAAKHSLRTVQMPDLGEGA